MKKLAFSSVVLFLLFSVNIFAASYGGGTGEPNSPYEIYDANQLNTIGLHIEDMDKCFILMNDIDISGFTGDLILVVLLAMNLISYLILRVDLMVTIMLFEILLT